MLEKSPFFTLSSDLLCLCDFEGHFVDINNGWEQVLGWKKEELISYSYYDFVHPDDIQKTLEISLRVQTEEVSYFLNRFRGKNGKYHWISWSGKPDSKKNIFYALGKDVSDNINHQQFLKQVIDSLPIAIFCKDAKKNFQFTLWNKTAEKLWGLTSADVLGKTDENFFPKEQCDFFRKKDQETIDQGVLIDIPEEIVDSPIGRFFIHTQKVPLKNAQGENQFLLGISEDITEKKRMAQSLEDARMQTLQNEKMATLGEMAGGIAHEINNPLSVIIGHTTNLKEKLKNNITLTTKDLLTTLEKIEETGFRIHKIIKSLRIFSRNEDNDPLEEVKLEEIINNTLALCEKKLLSKNISVTVEIPKNLKLKAHATQISQVLLNLLSNSQDALELLQEKWIKIEANEYKREIEITVTDSGNGIHSSIQNKIMNPFFTTKEPGYGTGLGLSISASLMRRQNGELLLDHNHKNTRFILRLKK